MRAGLALVSALLTLAAVDSPPSPEALLDAMERAGRELRSYRTVLVKQEWIGDGLAPEERFDVVWEPGRVRLVKLDEPAKGREIAWAAAEHEGKLRVDPHGFPWIPLTLDPYGSLALRETRHPVPESSIPFLVGLVVKNIRAAAARGEGGSRVVGAETLFGRPVWRFEAWGPPVVREETLGPGERLWDVARRAGHPVSPILQANLDRGWRTGNDGRAGDVVRVPRYYATRIGLWVDRETHLPLKVLIYDLEGRLFERFEHREGTFRF